MPKKFSDGTLIHISIAAKQLGLGECEMRGLVEAGEIPATKVERKTYLLQGAVRAYRGRTA